MIGGSLGGAITSPIIFAIGSTGAAKFKADMMISAGAVALVAKSLYDTQKAAEDFSVKMNALTTEQRKVALAMDASAKGIVDTGATFEITSKLIEAGVKPTRDFADAFGKTIGEAAARFNWSMDEATEKAKKLAEGIAKGSTRSLKEFGIDLINSEDQTLAQAEAIEKLIARSKDLDFELKTGRQQWDALTNAFDTAKGYMYDLGTDAIPGVSSALKGMVSLLGDATRGFEDIKTVVENTDFTVWQVGALGFLRDMGAISDELMKAAGKTMAAQKIPAAKKALTREGMEIGWAPSLGPIDVESITAPAARPARGGARTQQEAIDLSAEGEEAMWEWLNRNNEARSDSLELLSQEVELENILLGMTEDAADQAVDEYEINTQKWAEELANEQRQAAYEEARHQWRMQAMGVEQTRRVTDMEEWLGIEQEALDRSRDQWVSGVQGKMQLLGGMLSGWSALMNSENRKAFEVGKVAAIGETVINGIAGSIAAYKAMAGIPYVGPALGAVAAAGVIAASIAAVAKIKAQKFGGGAASSTGISSAAGSVGSGTGASSMSGAGAGGEQSINVNVTVPLDGEVIYTNQQKHNWNAARDGRPAFGWAAA